MFNYIGISWEPASEAQAAVVQRMAALLGEGPQWQPVFAAAGLRVYATGCKPGINKAYALPAGQGVALGRLFRRYEASTPTARDIEFSDREANAVVESEGATLIQQFWGRWVAFLPSPTGEWRVLRDPTGALPCFRVKTEGVVIVFSWLEDLLGRLQLPTPAVSLDAVTAMLVLRQLSGYETALDGVTQVLPGESTALSGSHITRRVLWSAADIARHPVELKPDMAENVLRDTTTQCVRAWGACHDSVVVRLSGGFDSAVMLGTLCSPNATASVVCLNYYSEGSDTDERGYARLAAARAGRRLIERRRAQDFRLEQVLHPARTPIPSNHLGRMGSDRMDAEVIDAAGATALFTGAGGDQLFQEVRCTWPAADYLQLRGLDRGLLPTVLDSARLARVSFWRALRLAFRDRFARHDPLDGAGQFAMLVPRDAIAGTTRRADRFVHPALLAASDLPIGKLYHLRTLICPFEHHNPYAPMRPFELVTPLMSQPVMEVCLSLPTYALTRGGQGRALARRAFADRIPPEIASRRSKGGTDDHATSVLRRSLPLAKALLLDGQLARRGLLDRQRVEAALIGRPSATDAYVAEIHACIAMEAWLCSVNGRSPGPGH